MLLTEKQDWASAKKQCNLLQADLAIITNAAEQQAIADYLKPLYIQYSSGRPTILSVRLSVCCDCLCFSVNLRLRLYSVWFALSVLFSPAHNQ